MRRDHEAKVGEYSDMAGCVVLAGYRHILVLLDAIPLKHALYDIVIEDFAQPRACPAYVASVPQD